MRLTSAEQAVILAALDHAHGVFTSDEVGDADLIDHARSILFGVTS